MSTMIAALAALLPSLLLLSLIALRDPKRLRSLPRGPGHDSRRAAAWTRKQRRNATLIALLPAPLLIASGAWPALLIWLGALLTVAWLWVNCLAPPARD
ncbi:hypothetical protein [Hydrocarboniphaga sp.]|uniref:hypothetical protein n=1 Tax=Hydrocarboniphaga sp. TaxID=2033016 RepID=UPI003D115051